MRKKYKKAGYPDRLIEHLINDFMKTKNDKLVPDWLFDVREKFLLRLPYCQQNEEDIKKFINHLTIRKITVHCYMGSKCYAIFIPYQG